MTDTQAELREKIALTIIDGWCDQTAVNTIADAILALLPPAPAVGEALEAFGALLSVMDYGDEDMSFTDDEAVSYRSDAEGNPVDDPMTFGHIRRARKALAALEGGKSDG